MIASAKVLNRSRQEESVPAWHELFSRMLPTICRYARISFRHLHEAREEAVQAVVCNACAAIARLAELGKLDLAYATVLAHFGVAQVRGGRMTGGHLNCKDISSPYCQRRKNVIVERLDKFDEEENGWKEAVVEDPHTPVFDQVWFRCDFPAWLKTLSRRNRKIALKLAVGEQTSRVSRQHRISAGRVSQLRRELHDNWLQFHGEAEQPEAEAASV